MKKILSILLFFLTFCSCAFSQGLFNNGALIVIQSSALVHVDGDANGKYTNNTGGGNDGRIDIDGNMEVEGNWTNNTFTDVLINNTDGNGWVKLNGAASSTQDITGNSKTVFENLEVNHATYGATCKLQNIQVNAQLLLTSGPLVLENNTFIVNNTATTGISRTSGYIVSETTNMSSRLQWNIGTAAAGNTFSIPFGTAAGSYIPFTASIGTAGTGAGNLTAATYPTAADNTPYASYPDAVSTMQGGNPLVADNSSNVVDRFWGITYNSFTSNPTATFSCTYTAAEGTGLTPANLQGQYFDVALTPDGWNSSLSGSGASYVVSGISGGNVSRVWTLVDKDNPLPVELLYFNPVCQGDKVISNWATASETNNDYFTVEKSADLSTWETVGVIPGSGSSSTMNTYSLTDNYPYVGFGYYRLKQTDFNGFINAFDPVAVSCNDNGNTPAFDFVSVYSDQNGNINIDFTYPTEGENFNFTIYDARGRLVVQQSKTAVSGFNQITFDPKDFAFGIYLIALSNNEKMISQKVLLK